MTTHKLTETARQKYYGGYQCTYTHWSEELKCEMNLAVYLPPSYSSPSSHSSPLPVLYFLSGLTCTHENFTLKSGVQRLAAKHGIVVVSPDTSPRGSDHPGEHEDWDFGWGAGFYLDASNPPWSGNYRMYSYITRELLGVCYKQYNISATQCILAQYACYVTTRLVAGALTVDLIRLDPNTRKDLT